MRYFFNEDCLRARVVIAPKADLDHKRFGQDHDTWYYKMYYTLLQPIVERAHTVRVFLDIKDTQSAAKARRLRTVLGNSIRDFDGARVKTLQNVRSHEVQAMQLPDILAGGLNYYARGEASSDAKLAVLRAIEELSGVPLGETTPLSATKLNLFYWKPR